ncbi:hypothetical protein SAMN04515658_102379 [Idiomarina zobellii]|jgi:hypothetical protein|nr:hypothetical protein SAMN04515658_102379 [Idiomarina zobellii]
MSQAGSSSENQYQGSFKPKMDNFETSLNYEGLTYKKSSKSTSIQELKRKYAR